MVDWLKQAPIKSMLVITDVAGGSVLGYDDDSEYDFELAQGVTYFVVGVGKMPTEYERGIEAVDVKRPPKGK